MAISKHTVQGTGLEKVTSQPVVVTSPLRPQALRNWSRGIMIDATDRQAYVQRHFRWNFCVNLAESSICFVGKGLVSYQTFLPVFLSLFTDSKILIGLVGTLIPVGTLLPQILIAPWIETLERKKGTVIWLALVEKLIYLGLGGLAYFSFRMPRQLLIGLLLTICALVGISGGITQVGWGELMATIFPVQTRGRYFGTSALVGGFLTALSAYLAGIVLSRYEVPTNYALIFFAGFCLIIFSWTFLFWIREPPPLPAQRKRAAQGGFLRGLADILKEDCQFRSFLVAQGTAVFGGMALPFVTVFGWERFNLDGYHLGLLTTSLVLGNTLASPVFGWLGDWLGHRKALVIATGCQALGLVLTVMTLSTPLLYCAVFLLGASRATAWVNVPPLVYEYAPLQRRPTYIGLSSSVFGFLMTIIPLAGGRVAQVYGYGALFTLSTLVSVVALVAYLKIVKEPFVPTRGSA